jgi:hypothetical protein
MASATWRSFSSVRCRLASLAAAVCAAAVRIQLPLPDGGRRWRRRGRRRGRTGSTAGGSSPGGGADRWRGPGRAGRARRVLFPARRWPGRWARRPGGGSRRWRRRGRVRRWRPIARVCAASTRGPPHGTNLSHEWPGSTGRRRRARRAGRCRTRPLVGVLARLRSIISASAWLRSIGVAGADSSSPGLGAPGPATQMCCRMSSISLTATFTAPSDIGTLGIGVVLGSFAGRVWT